MKWLKAATKTHSEAASSSQLAAAQPDGPASQGAVLHQDGEPVGQPLDQRGGPVGVEEADAGGHRADDPAGPLLAPGQQVEEPAEGAEEDHADAGGHEDQDRCRRATVRRGDWPGRGTRGSPGRPPASTRTSR